MYIVVALGLLTIEVSVWWLSHETTHTDNDILRRVGSRLERHLTGPSEKELKHVSDLGVHFASKMFLQTVLY